MLPYTPGYIESVMRKGEARFNWNCSSHNLRFLQVDRPDVVLLDHQNNAMYATDFLASVETNVVQKDENKWTTYQDFFFELHRLYSVHTVRIVVLIIESH